MLRLFWSTTATTSNNEQQVHRLSLPCIALRLAMTRVLQNIYNILRKIHVIFKHISQYSASISGIPALQWTHSRGIDCVVFLTTQ
jgi:hypothetical protein